MGDVLRGGRGCVAPGYGGRGRHRNSACLLVGGHGQEGLHAGPADAQGEHNLLKVIAMYNKIFSRTPPFGYYEHRDYGNLDVEVFILHQTRRYTMNI
jgi:hypothetical protein